MAKAAYTGEISFEYSPSQEYLLLPLCKIEGGVKVTGNYEIFEGDEVEVTFTISYRLKGQCSYCLADAEKEIEYSSTALFVTDKSDYDNYVYDGNRLDLTQAVNDALLISQPNVLLCREDCAGVKIN